MLDLLAMLGCDAYTQAAALWFEVAHSRPAVWEQRGTSQGDELQRLVAGQMAAERVWALHAQRPPEGGSEGLRRLLLAIIRDLRVVFILLARQLAKMRAASALPESERQELARLTRDIHSPLANRLGIWQLKWELEDLAFRYLQPDTYRRIASLLDERRGDRESFIRETLSELGEALRVADIQADLAGRPKHIFSIWKKMQRKAVEFSDLYDIRAVRVLVDNVADCYGALGVVHALWPHLPGEFDDYVARPKSNGYRSLHTAGDRSPVAKRWKCKSARTICIAPTNSVWPRTGATRRAVAATPDFEAKIAWMRKLLEPRNDDGELAAELQTELLEDRVYVLTPRGEVIDLPHGATVLDFCVSRAHRSGSSLSGRQGQRTHRAVNPSAAQRRSYRDTHRQDCRAQSRLVVGTPWLSQYQSRARQSARMVSS